MEPSELLTPPPPETPFTLKVLGLFLLLLLVAAVTVVAILYLPKYLTKPPEQGVQATVTFQGHSPVTCLLEEHITSKKPGTCYIEGLSSVLHVFTTQGEQAGTQWHLATPRK